MVDCWKACRMAGKFLVAQEYVSNTLAKVAAAAALYQRYKHEVTKNGEKHESLRRRLDAMQLEKKNLN